MSDCLCLHAFRAQADIVHDELSDLGPKVIPVDLLNHLSDPRVTGEFVIMVNS